MGAGKESDVEHFEDQHTLDLDYKLATVEPGAGVRSALAAVLAKEKPRMSCRLDQFCIEADHRE